MSGARSAKQDDKKNSENSRCRITKESPKNINPRNRESD